MRVMLLSSGINSQPESWSDWPNRVIPIVNQRIGDWRAQATFYATDALTVEAHESERVETFAKILQAYAGVEAHAWAHSNGTRVVMDGWKAAGKPPLKTVHLLCGAIDADCDVNGLNDGLLSGAIGDAYVYVAEKDTAMRIEDTLPGKIIFELPLGHQPLGLDGPKNVNPAIESRLHVIRWPDYDHSTCWEEGYFFSTVDQVMTIASGGLN